MEIELTVGTKVISKAGQTGTIIELDGQHITVDYGNRKALLGLDAFDKGFLSFADRSLQSQVDIENETARAKAREAEAEQKAREAEIIARRQQEYKKAKESAEQEKAKRKRAKKKSAGESPKPRPILILRRETRRRGLFLVCQKNTFEMEAKGGYIWAPLDSNKASHEEVEMVKAGDLIFHHFNNKLFAISVAKGDSQRAEAPFPDTRGIGRLVFTDYHLLSNPADTSSLKSLKASSAQKFGPFNTLGNNKGFYLAELPEELAAPFIQAAVAANPDDPGLAGYLTALD